MAVSTRKGLSALLVGVVAAAIVGVASVTARAATFTVTTTQDAADSNPGDGTCSSSAGCTLRAAIQEANATAGSDSISLPEGTFSLTIADSGADENAAARGDLDITNDLVLTGAGAQRSIVRGVGGSTPSRAFHVVGGPQVTLAQLAVTDSRPTADGGGLRIESGADPRANVTVTDAVFSGNGTGGTRGGAIYVVQGESLTIHNTSISGNVACRGGGIYNNGFLTVTSSAIFDNAVTAGECGGGGIYTGEENNESTVAISNSTISLNRVPSDAGGGGGIFADSPVSLTNVTMAGNSSPNGAAAIEARGRTVTVVNTIVANSSGANCATSSGGAIASQGHNIDSGSTCAFSGSGDRTNTDPRLRALQSNGGPTPTHALNAGSPAIDAADGGRCPATDQRGFPRPQDANADGNAVCDIGSYEVQQGGASPSPSPTGTTTASPTGSPTSSPTPSPSPTAPVEHGRTITIRLIDHLVVRGRVSAIDGEGRCAEDVPVKIQRRKDGRWRTVGKTFSANGGLYEIRLDDRTGRYRAFAPFVAKDFDRCIKAFSKRGRHRHSG